MKKDKTIKGQGAVKQKQKKVLKKIVENRGKSIGSAMREVGYSEAYAKNSDQMTKTKTWRELVEEVFPDDLLTRTHKAALAAKRQSSIKGLLLESEFPDFDIRLKALDMAYKVKGNYAPTKVQNVNPFSELDDDELDAEIAKMEAELRLARSKSKKKNK